MGYHVILANVQATLLGAVPVEAERCHDSDVTGVPHRCWDPCTWCRVSLGLNADRNCQKSPIVQRDMILVLSGVQSSAVTSLLHLQQYVQES